MEDLPYSPPPPLTGQSIIRYNLLHGRGNRYEFLNSNLPQKLVTMKTPFILVQEVSIDHTCSTYFQIVLKMDTTIEADCFVLSTSELSTDELSHFEINEFVEQAKEIADALRIVLVVKYDELYDLLED